jgi:hypothetical protein
MKKLLHLILPFLAASLLFVFFNVVLADPVVSTSQAGEIVVQTGPGLAVDSAPAGQSALKDGPIPSPITTTLPANQSTQDEGPITIMAITGLSITHSKVQAKTLTHFTATVTSGPPPIFYLWYFGDKTPQLPPNLPDDGSVVSHTYVNAGIYTTIVTAASLFEGDIATQSISLTVAPAVIQYLYLPVVLKNYSPSSSVGPMADLYCDLLSSDPPSPSAGQTILITTQIRNLPGVVSADGFWVDLYINPTIVPTTGNRFPWQDVCGPACPGGLAWGISNAPLLPGDNRTLVSIPNNFHPNGYDPAHSSWSGSLPAGTYKIYAYVDSIDNSDPNSDGAVWESDETNNRCELKLVVSAPRSFEIGPRPNTFPPRPTP